MFTATDLFTIYSISGYDPFREKTNYIFRLVRTDLNWMTGETETRKIKQMQKKKHELSY